MSGGRFSGRAILGLAVLAAALLAGPAVPGQEEQSPDDRSSLYPAGDLDLDGDVTPADVDILRSYLVESTAGLPAGAEPDFNGDGRTDVLDVYLLDRASRTDSIVGYLCNVPAGSFNQGSPTGEIGRNTDEGPQFRHTLSRGLLVMETEVTRRMWAELKDAQTTLPADPSGPPNPAQLDNPVKSASWYHGILFANLLSLQQGLTRCYYTDSTRTTPIGVNNYNTGNNQYCDFTANGYRLPTEGEWEYCCRSGTSTPFCRYEFAYNINTCASCTSSALGVLQQICFYCYNSGNVTQPAGLKLPNAWGLRDVHGNVWEWCWDWAADSYPAGPQTDYRGPASGTERILRGGACDQPPLSCRSAYRNWRFPQSPKEFYGFRLVRNAGQ